MSKELASSNLIHLSFLKIYLTHHKLIKKLRPVFYHKGSPKKHHGTPYSYQHMLYFHDISMTYKSSNPMINKVNF